MTMVRGGVVLAGAQLAMPSRQQMASTSMILKKAPWWSRKPMLLANVPFTAVYPHLGQAEIRVAFADAAEAQRGKSGFVDGLPAVAAGVRAMMKGEKAPHRLSPEAYPSRVRTRAEVLRHVIATARAG